MQIMTVLLFPVDVLEVTLTMQTSATALSFPPASPVKARTRRPRALAAWAARQTFAELPKVLSPASTSLLRPKARANCAKMNSGTTSLPNAVKNAGKPVEGMTGNAHSYRSAISKGNPSFMAVESGRNCPNPSSNSPAQRSTSDALPPLPQSSSFPP